MATIERTHENKTERAFLAAQMHQKQELRGLVDYVSEDVGPGQRGQDIIGYKAGTTLLTLHLVRV